jgi:hypothetical protein
MDVKMADVVEPPADERELFSGTTPTTSWGT